MSIKAITVSVFRSIFMKKHLLENEVFKNIILSVAQRVECYFVVAIFVIYEIVRVRL